MSVQSTPAASVNAQTDLLREDEIRRGIELLYFGYTRLTNSIDDYLATQGLGRAHHRALYFVARQPDLRVGELLKLLAITKQSLGRVLNDLQARGLVIARAGTSDRRQKLLRLTAEGEQLEARLFGLLSEKVSAAYTEATSDSVEGFWRVLEALVPEQDKPMVFGLRQEE